MLKTNFFPERKKERNAIDALSEQFNRIPISRNWREKSRSQAQELLQRLLQVETGSKERAEALYQLEFLQLQVGLPYSTIIKSLLENLQATSFER